MRVKKTIFSIARMLGAFAIASRWNRGSLGIICYHGFSISDEHRFRPKLFITPELFESRMQWLVRAGYRALGLDEAMQRLRSGKLGPKEIVITIDDGFHGVAAFGVPIMRALGLTATIYVTTYYVVHNNPVFRIVMQYLFWKTERTLLAAGFPAAGIDPGTPVKGGDGERVLWKLVDFGEQQVDEAGRLALASDISLQLDVDFEEIVNSRRFTLMNRAQIAELSRCGFDIQLHTHRHRLPEDPVEIAREIEDNRAVLEPLTGRSLRHLCYPSGIWSRSHWEALRKAGVLTATTCNAGLNSSDVSPFALRRFLDSQETPAVIFEAEVSGFTPTVKKALGIRAQGVVHD